MDFYRPATVGDVNTAIEELTNDILYNHFGSYKEEEEQKFTSLLKENKLTEARKIASETIGWFDETGSDKLDKLFSLFKAREMISSGIVIYTEIVE